MWFVHIQSVSSFHLGLNKSHIDWLNEPIKPNSTHSSSLRSVQISTHHMRRIIPVKQ